MNLQHYENYFLLFILLCFIIIFNVDRKEFVIPDTVNYILLILGIIVYIVGINKSFLSIENSARNIGILISILILIITIFFDKVLKKEILGYGDIKLFFGISLVFGSTILLSGIFIGSFIACIVEVILYKSKRNPIAFGPYLVVGFMISYYLNMLFILNKIFII